MKIFITAGLSKDEKGGKEGKVKEQVDEDAGAAGGDGMVKVFPKKLPTKDEGKESKDKVRNYVR